MMTVPTAIFFDIGGVLGTDGWDHVSRKRAVQHFNIDWDAFEKLHAQYAESLDTSTISVESYIEKTVMNTPREFSGNDFLAFMKEESQPDKEAIDVARQLSVRKKFFMATINNESRELNDYRLEKFGLSEIFCAFFSSGYLGVRKPDRMIYERTLWISHQQPETCVFIDDREANLQVPKTLGMQTIQFTNAAQLKHDLQSLGITDLT